MNRFIALIAGSTAVIASAIAVAQDNAAQTRGKLVFDNYCVHCHGTQTHNSGATTMLEEKYAGAIPGSLEQRTNLTFEFVETFVRGELGMAPYRPTEIPEDDFADLVAYLTRNNP